MYSMKDGKIVSKENFSQQTPKKPSKDKMLIIGGVILAVVIVGGIFYISTRQKPVKEKFGVNFFR